MKKMLLTRLIEDNQEDRLFFQKNDYEILEIPLLFLKKRQVDRSFERELNKSDWVFLTSQHAAAFFFQQQNQDKLQAKKFAVIGEKTAQVLLDNHVIPEFQAPFPTKKRMFEVWGEKIQEPTTIFYPKSNLADNAGEADLMALGHRLFTPILYDNVLSEMNKQQLKKSLLGEEIAAVYLTSPSLWQRFLSVFIETGAKKIPKLYCLGETTKQAITNDGYSVTIKEKDS